MYCFVFPINPNKIYVFLKTLPALEMLSLPSVQIWRLTITARAPQVLTQCFLLLKHLANTNSIILVIPFWRKLMTLFIPWYRRGNIERDQSEFKCLAWDLRSFYVLACWDATFMFQWNLCLCWLRSTSGAQGLCLAPCAPFLHCGVLSFSGQRDIFSSVFSLISRLASTCSNNNKWWAISCTIYFFLSAQPTSFSLEQ